MTGLGMILKSLGVKVTEENVHQIEHIIPQVPAKIQEVIAFLNERTSTFEARINSLEALTHAVRLQIEGLRKEQREQLEAINESIRSWQLRKPDPIAGDATIRTRSNRRSGSGTNGT